MMRIRGTIEEVMRTTFLLDDSLLRGVQYRWGEAIKRGDKERERHFAWMEHALVKVMKKVGVLK